MLFLPAGIIFPVVGIFALACMLAPVITAFFSGRTWCGYFCPRGGFNDQILSKVSLKRGIPRILKERWFKNAFLVLLMGAFIVQISYAWGDIKAVGHVFVRMVLLTTILGILLGISYQPRTWCMICPMGTMAHYVANIRKIRARLKHVTFIKDRCLNCKLCSRSCPMGIDVSAYRKQGRVENGACLKCRVCVENCPKQSLFIA